MMVSRRGGGVITDSGAWPCCGKGVAANSVQCTSCKKWIHRKCSGVKGSLQAASATFECKMCRGDVPLAEVADQGMEVADQGMEVDGETYSVVDSLCYHGDMLSADGGADAVVTLRVVCLAEVQGVSTLPDLQGSTQ